MSKVILNKLNLQEKSEPLVIEVNGQEIEVQTYLPLREKMDLIEIVIQESLDEESAYCNPVLVDILFHTYLVLSYTNISLNKTQKTNLIDTYDLLERNGIIDLIVSTIPEREYLDLSDSLYKCIEKVEKESNSVVSILRTAIDKTTEMLNTASEQLNGIDLNSESLKSVLAIAKDNGAI